MDALFLASVIALSIFSLLRFPAIKFNNFLKAKDEIFNAMLSIVPVISIFHLCFWKKLVEIAAKTACGSRIAHNIVIGAVERCEPVDQLVVPFWCWLVFQLL